MILSIIVAMSENNVIGAQGDLPWRLSSDLRRFKSLTMGHHLVLGRKTFESIRRPLPGRRVIVLTRDPNYQPGDSPIEPQVAHSLEAARALAATAGEDELFIGGGAQIYALALPVAQRMYLTRVHAHLEGDTHFPPFNQNDWVEISSRYHPADEKNDYAFTYRVLESSLTSGVGSA